MTVAPAFGGAELPPFEVGDRTEVYDAPGPDGARDHVVADWIHRPTLGWREALFLAVSVAVVRTLVGSVGRILAVPLTPVIAAAMVRGDRPPLAPGELEHAHPR